MKKIYILLIAIFIGNIANAQWQPLGSDDFHQVSQYAIFSSIVIDNSGTPIIAYKDMSDNGRIKVKKFNGISWDLVGDPYTIAIGETSYINIKINRKNNMPYVIYKDVFNDNKVNVKKFNGNNWVALCSNFISAGKANYSSIAIDTGGVPYVVYQDWIYNKKATVKKFNDSCWINVGISGFSNGMASYTNISLNNAGIPYVVYQDEGNNYKATVKKYYGNTWLNVGNAGFSAGGVSFTSIAINNVGIPYVVYSDSLNNLKCTVMKFNGTNWENVGPVGFSSGGCSYTNITFDSIGTPYVAYQDFNDNNKVTVKKFNGSIWIDVGSSGFSAGKANYINITMNSNNSPYIVYSDESHLERLTVMKYNGNSWVKLGSSSFSNPYIQDLSLVMDSSGTPYIIYKDLNNSQKATVKKYNGNAWVNVGNGIVSNTSADYPSIVIDKTGKPIISYHDSSKLIHVLKYDGNNWVNIGSSVYGIKIGYNPVFLDSSGTPYMVVNFSPKGTVIKYNGSAWVAVGNNYISNNFVGYSSFAFDNIGTPYVFFSDYSNGNKATVKKLVNGTWVPVGNEGFSLGWPIFNNIKFDNNGIPFVVYKDCLGDKVFIKKLIGSNWVDICNPFVEHKKILNIKIDKLGTPYVIYSPKSQYDYKSDLVSLKKFNGIDWISVGDTNFSFDKSYSSSVDIDATGKTVVAYDGMSGIWVKYYYQCNNPTYGGTIGSNQIICYGTNPSTLSNINYPNGLGVNEYKWQSSTTSNNTGFSDLAFSNSTSYNSGILTQTTWFKRLSKVVCNSSWTVSGESNVIQIAVNNLPSASGSINGISTVCQGQNVYKYSIQTINNALSYIWTLPSGAIGASSTDTIEVAYGTSAISGNITVKGHNSCGDGIISYLGVSVNTLPLTAGAISGNSSVVAGQQNVVYSVPIITNATSTNWDLPIGASINYYSGPTISVNFSQSAVSGNITVSGNNSCGDGPSTSLYVTVNPFNPNCSAQFDLVADTTSPHHYFAVNNASGVPPLQYNWSWGDGSFSTTAYPTHTYSAAGNYKICLTIIDSVGCTTTYCDSSFLQKDPNAIISVQVIPQGTLGISSLLSDKIKIYPNPAKENLIIELIESNISQKTSIYIYNIQGQLCRQIISNQSKTEVDIKDLSAGLYVVRVNNEKESFISRFVKE